MGYNSVGVGGGRRWKMVRKTVHERRAGDEGGRTVTGTRSFLFKFPFSVGGGRGVVACGGQGGERMREVGRSCAP